MEKVLRVFCDLTSAYAYNQSEKFHPPDALQRTQLNASYDPAFHGFSGPVQAAFMNAELMTSNASGAGIKQSTFITTCKSADALGLFQGADVNDGQPRGVFVTPLVSRSLRLIAMNTDRVLAERRPRKER